MKRVLYLFVVFLFFSFYIPYAYCENWVLFYKLQDDEKYYYDRESIERLDKKIVKVWQKRVKVDDDSEDEIERIQFELNCPKRVYKVLRVESKNSKEDVVSTPETVKFISIIGALYDNICK